MLSVGWEEDFNEVLFSLRKNKERLKNLRELTTSGKISSETFESLYKKFESELLESESKRQNLLEKLLTLQKDLQSELELLESELKKLEISIVLMSREIPLYYVLSKCMGKHDIIVIKSNFEAAPNFTLEIVKRGTKIHKELAQNSNYKELQQEKLSAYFFLASLNPYKALEFLSDKDVTREISRLSSEIERLSITSEEPHLLLTCPLKENVIHQLLSLTFTCGKAMEQTKSGM